MRKFLLIAAFVVGAGVLLMGAGVLLYVQEASRESTPEARNFRQANDTIAVHQDRVAFGNSHRAIDLAQAVCDELTKARAEQRKIGKRGVFSQGEGEFLAWCELHHTYVTVLVHVPGLDQYDREGRRLQGDLVWGIALDELYERFPRQEFELAVGLRGSRDYGPIRIGKTEEDNPASFDGKPEKLYRFFVRRGQ